MTGPIKVGMLSPYSGVYPHYGHHLAAGMLLGIYPGAQKRNEFQFLPAYTQLGDPKSTLEAVNRLVFFEQVDIVSGLINYKSVPDIIPVIERHNKIGFFFDIGEYIPWFDYLSPRLFYSSQQIWQTQYALGYWAGKEYGDSGMMIMTIYEAGYHINSCFSRGVEDACGGRVNIHVIPQDKRAPSQMDLGDFFEKIKKDPPPYVHAIFAGTLGNEFLVEWKRSGLHKTIPLIVVENMAYDDYLSDVSDQDLEIYSASTWNRTTENPRNADFVKRFEQTGVKRPTYMA